MGGYVCGTLARVAQHVSRGQDWGRAVRTLLIALLVYTLLVGLSQLTATHLALPPRVVPAEETTVTGRFSGAAAWAHVAAVTQQPHMYNSDANRAVRHEIMARLGRLGEIARTTNRGADYYVVDANDTVNLLAPFNGYYESNNILLKLQGKAPTTQRAAGDPIVAQRPALLISCHYDSTSLSHGVTDDGIAVGVMLELVRTALYRPQQDADLIFLWNNGEEMGLLGGQAFVAHPWFQRVHGFINLEGTGAAPRGTKSLLFRTNSRAMMRAVRKSAPYPHASVLFNELMAFVPSDTDYRPYAAQGRLQGVDIAFYTYRYLYHTEKDDLAHSDPLSAQHMGDNLVALVDRVANTDLLAKLPRSDPMDDPFDTMPLPRFLYYDWLGIATIVSSNAEYLFRVALLLGLAVLGASLRWTEEGVRLGWRRAFLTHVRPVAEALVLIAFTIALVVGGVSGASAIKARLNPASSYGHPELNLAWITALVVALADIALGLWPRVARALRLRKRATRGLRALGGHVYDPLPAARGTATAVSSHLTAQAASADRSTVSASAIQPDGPHAAWLPASHGTTSLTELQGRHALHATGPGDTETFTRHAQASWSSSEDEASDSDMDDMDADSLDEAELGGHVTGMSIDSADERPYDAADQASEDEPDVDSPDGVERRRKALPDPEAPPPASLASPLPSPSSRIQQGVVQLQAGHDDAHASLAAGAAGTDGGNDGPFILPHLSTSTSPLASPQQESPQQESPQQESPQHRLPERATPPLPPQLAPGALQPVARRPGSLRVRRMRRRTRRMRGLLGQTARTTLMAYLPMGLTATWCTFLLGAFVLALHRRLHAPYFLYDWALFACIALGIEQVVAVSVRRWWRRDVGNEHLTSWQTSGIRVYQTHLWWIRLVGTTALPGLLTLDVLREMRTAAPSLLADGLPEVGLDVGFAVLVLLVTLNGIPALARANIQPRFGLGVLLVVVLPLYLRACVVFPFGADTPQRLLYQELWDVTNTTTAAASTLGIGTFHTTTPDRWLADVQQRGVRHLAHGRCGQGDAVAGRVDGRIMAECLFPGLPPPQLPMDARHAVASPVDLIQVRAAVATTAPRTSDPTAPCTLTVTGTVVGTPGSRICAIGAPDAVRSRWDHTPADLARWVWSNGTTLADPGAANADTRLVRGARLLLFRRGFDGRDRRIRSPFAIDFHVDPAHPICEASASGVTAMSSNATWQVAPARGSSELPGFWIECFHSQAEVSQVYRDLKHGDAPLPPWQQFAHGRWGEVMVRRSFEFAPPTPRPFAP